MSSLVRKEYLFFFILICFFIFSATLNNLADTFFYVLSLMGIFYFFKDRIELPETLIKLNFIVLLSFIFILFSIVFFGEYEKLFKFRFQNFRDALLVFFISYLFVKLNFDNQTIFKIIVISSLYSVVYIALLSVHNPARGVGLLETPITRGNMAMLLGVLSLISLLGLQRIEWKILALLGFLGGVFLSLLSGSRGGWLTLFIAYATVLYFTFRFDRKLFVGSLGVLLVIIFTVYFLWDKLPIQDRLLQTINSLQLYYSGDANTSLGWRFEMWKGAWIAFVEKPFLGWGFNNFNLFFEQMKLEGIVVGKDLPWGHPHNDFLLLLSELGIFGFALVLSTLFYPLFVLMKKAAECSYNGDDAGMYISLMGIILIESLLEFMISDQTITVKFPYHFYLVLIVLILVNLNKYHKRADE